MKFSHLGEKETTSQKSIIFFFKSPHIITPFDRSSYSKYLLFYYFIIYIYKSFLFSGTIDSANDGHSFFKMHANPPEDIQKLNFSQNFTLGLAVRRLSTVKHCILPLFRSVRDDEIKVHIIKHSYI